MADAKAFHDTFDRCKADYQDIQKEIEQLIAQGKPATVDGCKAQRERLIALSERLARASRTLIASRDVMMQAEWSSDNQSSK